MSTSASSSEYPSSVSSLVSPIPYGPDESLTGGATRGSYESENTSQHQFAPHPNAEGILVGLGLNQERSSSGRTGPQLESVPRRVRTARAEPQQHDRIEPLTPIVDPQSQDPPINNNSLTPSRSHASADESSSIDTSILGAGEARNSSGEPSFDFGSVRSGHSDSSGKTIYIDAQESVANVSSISEVSLNPRYSQGPQSSSHGLVTVTPMRASLQDTNLSSNRLDFSANNYRGAMSGDYHGSRSAGASSAYKASPLTSRRRRDRTDAQDQKENEPGSIQRKPDPALRESPSVESPKPHKKRRPLGIIYNAKGRNKTSGAVQQPKHQQKHQQKHPHQPAINLQFGRPRDTSGNSSHPSSRNVSQTSQADSLASSDGHLYPNRRVKDHPVSLIRRSRSLAYGDTHFFAGMPRAPYLFNTEPDSSSPLLFAQSRYDVFGRKPVPLWVSLLLLVACTVFPPLWLLLGAGYFDRSVGPISHKVKLVALGLALLSFGGLTAVSIVICITQRG